MEKQVVKIISMLLVLNAGASFAASMTVTAINDSPNSALVTIGDNSPVNLAPNQVKYLSVEYKYSDRINYQSSGIAQTGSACQYPILVGNQTVKLTGITISITQDAQSKKANCMIGWE